MARSEPTADDTVTSNEMVSLCRKMLSVFTSVTGRPPTPEIAAMIIVNTTIQVAVNVNLKADFALVNITAVLDLF
jgi:hypothetical protein